MQPEQYWKLKCQMMQLRLEETQLQMAFQELEGRKLQFLKENNFPSGNIRFDDQQFIIEEIKDGK